MSFQYSSPEAEENDMQPIEDYSPDAYQDHSQSPPQAQHSYSRQRPASAYEPKYSRDQKPSSRLFNKDSYLSNSQYNLPVSVPAPSEVLLSKVFDEELSVRSPSQKKRLKLLQHKMSISQREESPEFYTKGNVDLITAKKFKNYHEEAVPFVEKADKLHRSIESLRRSSEFKDLEKYPIEEKIAKYSSCLENPSKEIKLAGLQGIHELIETENITNNAKEIIIGEVLNVLMRWDEHEPDFTECALDIIGSLGPHPMTLDQIPLFVSMVVHDETSEYMNIHQAAFACLCRLGFHGVDALIRLASKDYPHLQIWLLDKLALTNAIQRQIIVPALSQDALSPDSTLRTQAVAALNRMYSVVWEGGALPVLLTLMEEGSVDRQLIACTIRACGNIGEQTLIKLLRQSDAPKIRMASAAALCWRVPIRPRQLEIRVINDSITYEQRTFPGTICTYKGPLTPVIVQSEEDDAILEINARDFLACLQRWIKRESEEDLGEVFPNLPIMPCVSEAQTEESPNISINAIQALCGGLKDPFEGVRETCTYALGFIGLPEAADSANFLIKLLKDASPQVRTMAAWALGRLGPAAYRAGPGLIELLKDGYWKVRTAACISLASTGQNIAQKAIPVLFKILRDGSINRGTVAETIVRLGPQGERLLIDLLNHEPNSNITLRTGAVKALSQANIYHNNIDFVVETLFRLSNDRMPAVRKEVFLALNTLSERAKNQITYLKPRSLLPLYFRFLNDPAVEVKDTAMKCIVLLGPQGQLMLIEALTKDQNPQIRAQAAKGLGLFGPSTFRSLLLGLHDSHPFVRKIVAQTISNNFTAEAISEEFWEKVPQRQGIRCTIKEILKLPYPVPQACGNLLKELLMVLEQEFAEGGRGYEYMDSHPELHKPLEEAEEEV
ncbi:unnamed protein product [Blepharisma stoltei]|uniref:Uncharacterized protein n=1 Tax=Blepharisma stoltei TaxID=1481888 RepID=A0AAU9KPV5_9CILI|nr:unnamed protein product [Blepharisma stoltei]